MQRLKKKKTHRHLLLYLSWSVLFPEKKTHSYRLSTKHYTHSSKRSLLSLKDPAEKLHDSWRKLIFVQILANVISHEEKIYRNMLFFNHPPPPNE